AARAPHPPSTEENRVPQTHPHPDVDHVLLSEQQIQDRLAELGARIAADYADEPPILVGVLKGAVMVMADLSRRIELKVEMDWMAVSSYGSGTKSSGVVRILKDLGTDISGRHVLIVEDIIDSGLTLKWLLSNLRSRGPESVEIATLLRKPDAARVDIDVKYIGFDIPNEFVVGYGLDYAEAYRNLPYVAVLNRSVYEAPEGLQRQGHQEARALPRRRDLDHRRAASGPGGLLPVRPGRFRADRHRTGPRAARERPGRAGQDHRRQPAAGGPRAVRGLRRR